ncbi:MAG: hypothetical protein ACK5V0_12135, partial [Alphaproteobacteria bacterium]
MARKGRGSQSGGDLIVVRREEGGGHAHHVGAKNFAQQHSSDQVRDLPAAGFLGSCDHDGGRLIAHEPVGLVALLVEED